MVQNAKPIILGPNNAVITATLTVSTEAVGYPKECLHDYRPELRHKGTGASAQWIKIDAGSGNVITADALGIAGHDLKTQSATGLVLAHSANDADYTDAVPAFTPASDNALAKFYASAAARYWKLTIPSYTLPPSIGALFIGPRLAFPRWPANGWNPQQMEKKGESNTSRRGRMLGRQIMFTELTADLQFQNLLPSWVEGTWLPFFRDHLPNPFFWVHEMTNHPTEVYYCECDGNPKLESSWDKGSRRDLKFKLRGVVN